MAANTKGTPVINWDTVTSDWIKSNFIDASTANPTLYTEIAMWNYMSGLVGDFITDFPAILTEQIGDPNYVEPVELDAFVLMAALSSSSEVSKNSFTTSLRTHQQAALIYKEKVVDPTQKVYGRPLVGYTASQTGHAVGNMIKLLNQIPKWWQQSQDAKNTATANKVLKNLEKKGIIESYGNGSVYVIEDGNTTIPSATDKIIIFRPKNIRDIDTVDANGEHRYNPPPHKTSRVTSPIAYLEKYRGGGTAFKQEGVGEGYTKDIPAWLKATDLASTAQLGFFYQDAANTNKSPTWVNQDAQQSTSMKELYGFQFMYNPTTISQTLSTDASVDWTGQGIGASADPAIPLFGNSTVTFQLFLNRIADMSALKGLKSGAGTSTGYRRKLTSAEVNGLLTRGTEYDLEFLFRTINGTPYMSPTMSNNLPTADFGLLMGMPIWLKIHENLRYKGVVVNVGINHIMFTRDMVPMLTEVYVSFMRIPVITWDTELSSKALGKYVSNTNTDQSATP